ncbi:cytochrome P450 [Exidia glandulosa HHB12029]|uniref:Cytochrome P450 n=1 Tax=Exidia glandulosa HHB12029 TaxID=1314781 RepID=A0A165K0I5_EXIGL|nr:cytochrome P450 [Exidia glandulosa HHB12029]
MLYMSPWMVLRVAGLAVLALLVACILMLGVYLGYVKLLSRADPLRQLPGTESGLPMQCMDEDVEEWARKLANARKDGVAVEGTPRNLHFPGLWPFEPRSRLITLDYAVLQYILNSPIYEKPRESRNFLTMLFGKGIFNAEGADHKAMRKAYAHVFSMPVLRSLYPTMLQKAEQMCELWSGEVKASETADAVVDVNSYLGRATLDVIASAGFGQDLNAVADPHNVVYNAFRNLMSPIEKGRGGFMMYLSLKYPWLWSTPAELSRAFVSAKAEILRVGKSLLRVGTQAEDEEKSASGAPPALLKNILRTIAPAQGLADSELLGHLSTFLFNGSDSTGSSAAWALHYLSLDLSLQQRVRDEVAEVPNDADRAAALERLPILDRVVRETLRLMPPLHSTIRMATRDDVIRTSEDVVLRDGSVVREFAIKKGQFIHIPLLPLNTLTDIWGADAKEFRPDRWLDIPETVKGMPGMLHLMSFTSGPHGCPGYKLALAEIRVFIAAAVQHFEFTPAADVRTMNSFMMRPYVHGQWAKLGPTLPLKIKPVVRA